MAEEEFILDDSSDAEIIYSPVCSYCKHFNWKGREIHECDAFPYRISDESWRGDNDHKKPYPGDHGIRFEPLKR